MAYKVSLKAGYSTDMEFLFDDYMDANMFMKAALDNGKNNHVITICAEKEGEE